MSHLNSEDLCHKPGTLPAKSLHLQGTEWQLGHPRRKVALSRPAQTWTDLHRPGSVAVLRMRQAALSSKRRQNLHRPLGFQGHGQPPFTKFSRRFNTMGNRVTHLLGMSLTKKIRAPRPALFTSAELSNDLTSFTTIADGMDGMVTQDVTRWHTAHDPEL